MSTVRRVVSVLASRAQSVVALLVLTVIAGLVADSPAAAETDRVQRPGVPAQTWSLFGNRSTDPAYDFLGTTDAAGLAVRTANQERLRIIGNTFNPQANSGNLGNSGNSANSDGRGTGRAEFYTDLWVRADQREPWIPLDYPFRVTPDVGSLTVSNDGQVEIYSPVVGFPLLAGGDTGSLSVANTGQVVIDAPVAGDADALQVIGESGDFLVSGNGKVTIQSTQEGTGAVPFHHALVVNGADQGIAVSLDRTTPGGDNNFVTFFNRNGDAVGCIEGQTWDELLFSPEMFMKSANIAMQAVALGMNITEDLVSDGGFDASDTISLTALLTYEGFSAAAAFANVGVSFQSGGADYAEYLARADDNEEISCGDIIGVFGGRITKKTAGAGQVLVVSSAPAVVGNMPAEGEGHRYEKVALLGQTRVKVIGAVEEGDYIIPSGLEDGAGIAVSPAMMTAEEFTKIVGRAWDSSPSAGLKYVKIAVGVNSGDLARLLKTHEDEIAALRAEVAQNKGAAQASLAELDALRADIASLRQAVLEATRPESAHRQTTGFAAEGDPGAG
jgi:hypothetical protein